MDYYSYNVKHCHYWLYYICMPSDNEFVACVDRKKSDKHTNTYLV